VGDLTRNFSVSEFTRSDKADELGIDNVPTEEARANLKALCQYILQPLRDALGPVSVSSGYRNPELNTAVGGVQNSFHARGLAADINVQGMTAEDLALWIADSALPYAELILEYPANGNDPWVHVAFNGTANPDREQWTYVNAGSRNVVKLPGIVPHQAKAVEVLATSNKSLLLASVLLLGYALLSE